MFFIESGSGTPPEAEATFPAHASDKTRDKDNAADLKKNIDIPSVYRINFISAPQVKNIIRKEQNRDNTIK